VEMGGSLKLLIKGLVDDLGGREDDERQLFDLARLTCIVIDERDGMRIDACKKMIGGHAHVVGKGTTIPEFDIERDAQIATYIKLRRGYLDETTLLSQQFCNTGRLMKAKLIVYQHMRSWGSALFSLKHLPDGGNMGQVGARNRRELRKRTSSDDDSIGV